MLTFMLKKYNDLCQSSEYESDSEEEQEQVEFRPVFVPKCVMSFLALIIKLILKIGEHE
jgi:hypothetical protein